MATIVKKPAAPMAPAASKPAAPAAAKAPATALAAPTAALSKPAVHIAKPNPATPSSAQVAAVIAKANKTKAALADAPVQAIALEDNPETGIDAEMQQEHVGEAQDSELVQELTGQEVAGHVLTENKDGTQTHEKFPIPGHEGKVYQRQHATIGFSCGLTKNLGDYNNVKVQVSLFLPCEPSLEEIEETFTSAKEWVDEKISGINEELEALVQPE